MGVEKGETAGGRQRDVPSPSPPGHTDCWDKPPTHLSEGERMAEGGDGTKESKHVII